MFDFPWTQKKKKNYLMYENKINLVFIRMFDFLISPPN
jgi:hypothetical protein